MSILPNLTLVADALGWAVLHSLWQGALAAIAVWGFRALTRAVVGERAADTRYMFGFLTLVALFAAFIGTFLYYYNLGVATGIPTTIPTQIINIELSNALPTSAGNPLLQITSYTDVIGAIWALCFMALGARYLAAFRLTHKLRTTGTAPLPSNWSARFVALAKQSGVNDKVCGFLSEHVASPVTFGFFKPIVLLPTWFFTGMSPEQCEAVLLHELAHIRRHDYLTNIFQILIKTVFFYHPAVQYICTNINIDREHACDDLAVNLTRNPESLATALGTIRIKAARNAGVYAQIGILGADDPDAPIMHRLKRLMGVSTRSRSNGTARGFAATGMMVITAGLMLALSATQSQAHPASVEELTNKTKTESSASSDKNSDLKITGDGYKVVGNTYYLKGKNGYGPGIRMKDGYEYAFKTENGKTYAIRTDKNGQSIIENSENHTKNATEAKHNYQYSAKKIAGRKYKTKTDTIQNITYINIDGNWHDLEGVNFKNMLPAPPVAPLSPIAPIVSMASSTAISPITPISPVTPLIQGAQWGTQWNGASTAQAKAWRKKTQATNREWEQELAADQAEFEKEWAEQMAENQQDLTEEQRDLEDNYAEEQRDLEQEYRDTQDDIEGTQNERAEAQRELDQDFANEQRELALEFSADQRELAQDNAEQQREMAQERQEAQRDWAEARREAVLEQAEHRREAEQEARQQAQDERQFARNERQRVRDKAQRIRDTEQRVRDKEQRARDTKQRVRDKEQRQKDKKRAREYEKMRTKLIPLLKAEDYIKSANSKVEIKVTETDITINGKKLNDKNGDRYSKIISRYIKSEGANMRIAFKPGYMHVSTNNKNGHTYSYTQKD
ncbi:MAG: hypothetical protein COA69_02305 [Robiginitomaculum sp.]|nr:MAG: hypothetical protein COA69_02305 [Robiginitomaculum sp.]